MGKSNSPIWIVACGAWLLLAGCSPQKAKTAGDVQPSPDPAPAGGRILQAAYSSEPSSHTLEDHDLGMTAATVHTPANWLFRGAIVPQGPCAPTPYGVYRATSPDGLSFVEQLPVYGWVWTTGAANGGQQQGCLHFQRQLSATEFLKVVSATLNVRYLGEEPVPAGVNQSAQRGLDEARAAYAGQYAASGLTQPRQTRELARAAVEFRNGSYLMKGRLSAVVDCTQTRFAGLKSTLRGMASQADWSLNRCTGRVHFFAAPEAKYAATVAMLDKINLDPKASPAWVQAWIARNQAQTNQNIRAIQIYGERQRAATTAHYQQAMAISAANHRQFMETLQRGTDLSMQRAAQVADSNHRSAMDTVDYALDRQTVRDPQTGQLTKVSSALSYTWLDETGKTSFQSNDVNADPNNRLTGTWTRQDVVHGDGSP